jgi:hypothetical protein
MRITRYPDSGSQPGLLTEGRRPGSADAPWQSSMDPGRLRGTYLAHTFRSADEPGGTAIEYLEVARFSALQF